MDVETHEILFPFDQPDSALPSLLKAIQQSLSQLKTRSGKSIPLLQAHCVLIIDGHQERAVYLAQALSLVGYRVLTVPHALEAFTLFLQGAFVPLLIITGQDDPGKRFFQQRLAQQVLQRFDVEVPLIRLTMKTSSLLGGTSSTDADLLLEYSGTSALSSSLSPVLPDRRTNLQASSAALPWEKPSYSPNTQDSGLVDPNFPPSSVSPQVNASYHSPFQQAGDSYSRDIELSLSAQSPLRERDRGSFSPDQDLSHGDSSDPQLPFSANAFVDWSVGSAPPVPSISSVSQTPISQTSPLKPPVKMHVKISLEGQSLGRYQVDALIGNGPLGDVYQVYDRLREMHIALKAIQTDTISFAANLAVEEEHMFQRESAILSRLKHAHIAPLLNTGKSYISGSSFIYKTMPFYPEGNLTQWLYGQGGQKAHPPSEILPLIVQLGDALQFTHDQQVLFLNFKPGNILLKEPAKKISELELILSDFLIPFDNGVLPITNDALPYIAPERWEGRAQAASDQYALAVLAYELLTGRSLFMGTNEQIMKRLHLTRNPQPPSILNPLVSAQVSSILLRALAKRPEERFASVGLFAQALQRFGM
jgi:Protein kinase domain